MTLAPSLRCVSSRSKFSREFSVECVADLASMAIKLLGKNEEKGLLLKWRGAVHEFGEYRRDKIGEKTPLGEI